MLAFSHPFSARAAAGATGLGAPKQLALGSAAPAIAAAEVVEHHGICDFCNRIAALIVNNLGKGLSLCLYSILNEIGGNKTTLNVCAILWMGFVILVPRLESLLITLYLLYR